MKATELAQLLLKTVEDEGGDFDVEGFIADGGNPSKVFVVYG